MKMPRLCTACLWGLVAALVFLPAVPAEADPEERSPFEMVRWTPAGPQVQVRGAWYELVALDAVPAARVIQACRTLDADRWEKRFCEDLVAALATIGHDLGARTTLTLRAPGRTDEVRVEVPATRENRNRIRDARPWKAGGAAAAVQRVRRDHATRGDPALAFLALRHHGDARTARIPAAQAREDLDQLEWWVENVFAYEGLRPFDHRAAFDTVRAKLDSDIALHDFHIQLRKLVALFGDGHSRVRGVLSALPTGALPFALVEADGRVAALTSTGRTLDGAHPYVEALDGRAVDEWLEAAARLNARGSPALQRRYALEVGCLATFVRRELGLPVGGPVEVTLGDAAGKRTTRRLGLVPRPLRAPRHLRSEPAVLDGGIGYIPIRSMTSEAADVEGLVAAVRDFATAPGLVIDVRGNGGGSRDLLRALLPHLLAADAQPVLCNVAAYRLPPGVVLDPVGGHLANRALYPATWPGFTEAERAVVEARLSGFRPDVPLASGRFTPLHALVVSPAAGEAWRYAGPIALLVDGDCFSATDVFVGALETLPQVSVLGTSTGGGSGRAREYRLQHSGLRVRLSSMASFRPDGRRYDGVGIAPDLPVPRTLADAQGRTDSVLEAALAQLRR